LIALVGLPSDLLAQGIRLPRGRTPTPTQPAAKPPEAPAVARALAYKRSRWSAEGYAVISSIQTPDAGGATKHTTYGTGTRADYRYSERFSATVDFPVSLFPFNQAATTETAEIGTRFRPLSPDQLFRPFFDVRAGYMHMYDRFPMATETSIPGIGSRQQFSEQGRYSRGLGGLAGAGLEYSLTPSLALTSEVSAMRNRMTTYRLSDPASVPIGGSTYWMTSFRYTLGLKYNAVRALHLRQDPTS